MATANSKLAITGKPVWFITGCATGIGRARKSSCCGGRRMPVNRTGRLCVSNITSVRRA